MNNKPLYSYNINYMSKNKTSVLKKTLVKPESPDHLNARVTGQVNIYIYLLQTLLQGVLIYISFSVTINTSRKVAKS